MYKKIDKFLDSIPLTMNLTTGEKSYLKSIAKKLKGIETFMKQQPINESSADLDYWYNYLNEIKGILGNFNNDISFVASLMAKKFLLAKHKLSIDISAKPQGAPGLDINEQTADGKYVIAEIKTTIPYHENDFGSQQITMIKKDLDKLRNKKADYKYFFVTELKTYEILKRKYSAYLEGIILEYLPASSKTND